MRPGDDEHVTDEASLVLAVDVGGTAVKAEVLDADLRPVLSASAAAPRGDGEAMLATVVRLAQEQLARLGARDRARVVGVGLAVPGIVDVASGVAVLATNLGWRDTPLVRPVSAALGLPVLLSHDVTAAGLAEMRLGAGRGADDVLVVVVGTGVAAVIVCGGQIVHGGLRQAGELGHIVVRPGGPPCGCGARGCLEAVSSASAIARAYAAATGTSDLGAQQVRDRLGHDPVADAVWAEAVEALADAIITVALLLSPTRVVVGGGLAEAGDALLGPLREAMAARAHAAAVPDVVPAALGSRAGVVGAALVARERLGVTR